MEKEELFSLLDQEKSLTEKIGMILSNRCDYGSANGAMLSVKQFDKVAEDIIQYFDLTPPKKKIN